MSCFSQIRIAWKMLECRIFILTRQSLFLTLFVDNFIQLWHHSCPTFTEQEKLEKIPGKTQWSISVLTIFFPFQADWIFNCLIYTWQESQCPLWIFTPLNICLNIFQLVTEASDVWSQSNLNPKPLHCHTGFWRTKEARVFTLHFRVPRIRLGHSTHFILRCVFFHGALHPHDWVVLT